MKKSLIIAVAAAVLTVACKQNHPPQITSLVAVPTHVFRGDSAVITATVTDPDGDSVSYAWTASRGFLSVARNNTLTWIAPNTAGACTVGLIAKDPAGAADSATTEIEVEANHAPVLDSLRASSAMVRPGDSSVVTAFAHDVDFDSLAYEWSASAGLISSGRGTHANWLAPTSPGTCTVWVVVKDPTGLADTGQTLIAVVANQPPVITGISVVPAHVKPYAICTLQVVAHDPEGTPLRFHWTATDGLLPDSTAATVEWIAPLWSGSYKAVVSVTDSEGASAGDSISMGVDRDTTTIIDQSVHVNAADYRYFQEYLTASYNVTGYFQVQMHDINFYVFDETNYNLWRTGQNSTGEVVITRSSYSSYSFSVPASGNYYFVLDNQYSTLTPKDVYLLAQTITP